MEGESGEQVGDGLESVTSCVNVRASIPTPKITAYLGGGGLQIVTAALHSECSISCNT